MKNNFKYLAVLLVAFFLFSTSVFAKPVITKVVQQYESSGTKDLYLVYADANGGTITGYMVTSDIKGTNGEAYPPTSATQQYITLPNGLYYVWVKTTNEVSDPFPVYVNDSCTAGGTVSNATDTGSYERCYRRYYDGREAQIGNASDATCAAGYNMDAAYSTISANDCSNKNALKYGLEFRYCRKAYNYKCVKTQSSGTSQSGITPSDASTGNAKLASLSVSSGTLTPGFQPSTVSYAVTTDASQITVSATLQNSAASFVNGYGPRTVNLGYGTNVIEIKTKDGNTSNTYTIKVKRADQRSSVNTLSSLNVTNGKLSPDFNPLVNAYNVAVSGDAKSVDVTAVLSDSNASFVDGFGPRTVELTDETTRASIKVKAQSGAVRTYSMLFYKEGSEVTQPDNHALLKSLELSAGKIEFDSNTFDYNVTVPYDVTSTVVTAIAQDENDEVVVNGGENLEADKLNEISIIVTSSDGKYSNTYTIYVIRKNEDLGVSNNSLLSDLSIKDYNIKFDAKKTEYKLSVQEGVNSLVIYATPADNRAVVSIEGNENLKNGSEVKVRVTAEDNSYTDYVIKIKMVGKGGNVFLTIIVVILIILALAYLVLRAMGYKIYLNFDAVKDKVKGIFKRNK